MMMRAGVAAAARGAMLRAGRRRMLHAGVGVRAGTGAGDTTEPAGGMVQGELLDMAVDLRNARPGEIIEVPYELTVTTSFRDFWQASFHSHDRLYTSTPFARKLSFQDQLVPFSMMLFLTGSMSHADAAKVQVGFHNAVYHWPGFPGDTFTKRFTIKSLRSTSDQQHSIFTFECQLINQRGKLCFSTEKTMLFPFLCSSPGYMDNSQAAGAGDEASAAAAAAAAAAGGSATVAPASTTASAGGTEQRPKHLKKHLLDHSSTLNQLGNQTLTQLRPGQLILHTFTRPLSASGTMQLASLGRITHERHFNTTLFNNDELFVPGGLVLGLALSASGRDLHEILYEELVDCSYPNNLHPGETVTAITFVRGVKESVSGDLEFVDVKTIGIKNVDTHRDLLGLNFPTQLFEQNLMPKHLEELLAQHCPELSKKVVVQAERKIVRQAPMSHPAFLL